jgi:hypothetical protein
VEPRAPSGDGVNIGNLLKFRQEAPRTAVEAAAEEKRVIEHATAKGVTLKDRCATRALLRDDGLGRFRIMCFCPGCVYVDGKPGQFDLTGQLEDARTNGGFESLIVQQIIEHQQRACADLKNPKNTTVYRNRNTPNFYSLTIEWPDIELTPEQAVQG